MSERAEATDAVAAPSLAAEPAPVAGGERVPWSGIYAYNVPTIGVGFMFFLVGLQLMKYSTDVFMISPAVMGTIFGISRLWDAISDPIAGYLSDRTHSRLGRRRPWLLASALPIGGIYVMMWTPPEALSGVAVGLGPVSISALTLWMTAGVFGFYSAMTIFVVPHASLGAELTTGYHDRSRVFGVRHALWTAGSVLALIGMYYLIVASLADDGGAAARSAATRQALVASVVTVALIVYSVAVLRERSEYQGRGAEHPFRAFWDVVRNRHARLLLIVTLIENLGAATIGILTLYIAEYVVGTPRLAPLYILCYFVPSIASVPLWMPLARRFGKKPLWVFSMLLTAVSFGGMFFLEQGSWLLISVLAFTAGTAAGCGGMIQPSIQADVIDYDEYTTGERKEGAYFAAWNLVFKTSFAVTLFITGWVLELSGFRPNQEQGPGAVLALKSLYAIYPFVCFVIGSAIFLRFDLNEKEHAEIRRALDRRYAAKRP